MQGSYAGGSRAITLTPENVLSTLWQLHHETLAVNQERWTDGGWTCNDEAEHFSLIPDLEPRSVDVSTSARKSES